MARRVAELPKGQRITDYISVGVIIWGWKSPRGSAGRTLSRTARASTVRWGLKEAAGKALA